MLRTLILCGFCLVAVGCQPPAQGNAGGAGATGPKALAATPKWQLQSITRGGVVTAMKPGAKDIPSITFKSGKMFGSGSCNSFDGTYRAYATGEFKNYGMSMTEMACLNMKLEDDFISVLGNASKFAVANGTLTLKAGNDQLVFVAFKPPAPLPLSGTKWTLLYFGESTPDTGSVANTTGTVTLTIAEDGSATGSTGCNGYGASITIDGQAITVGELTQTLQACASDELMKQETLYTGLFPRMTTFSITDEQLTLQNADGSRSLIFEKSQ